MSYPTPSTQPGGLLDKYKLLLAVINSKWSTGLDHKVAGHMIERHMAKHRNARLAIGYLEKATGSSRTRIVASIRRLISKGVIIEARKGSGTRPSEYDLKFDFLRSVQNVTSNSGVQNVTPSSDQIDTSTASRGVQNVTESHLRDKLTSLSTVNGIEGTPGVASPPPPAGLAPVGADSPVDPKSALDELWAVYPLKRDVAKARAAYKALNPDPELHAQLVTAAAALAEHYRINNVEKKWWKALHNWLAEERYLEDLPPVYEDRKAAAKERTPREQQSDEPISDQAMGLSYKAPIGRHEVEIVDAVVSTDDREQTFGLRYRIRGGKHDEKHFAHKFYLISQNEVVTEGSKFLRSIGGGAGLSDGADPPAFLGKHMQAIVSRGGTIQYQAI